MPKLILFSEQPLTANLSPHTLSGGGQKLAVATALLFWALFAQAQTPPTLCQQYGSQAADVTIGTPINNQNQQGVTFLSTLYPNGAVFQNQKIRINGILKVDRSLSLFSCRIELERGAQIVTDGANWMLSIGSQFYSCGQMWQGIYVKSAGTAGIYFGQVEDAEAFLTLDDGAAAGVYGVTFNRNHIGIRNGSATLGVASVNLPIFGANIFDCTSALLPPFNTALSPSHTGISYSGIYLNTAVGIFSSFQTSFFRNMHFGIALENADATVFGCDFQSMVIYSLTPTSNNGIRVLGGALNASFCNFGQLNHGIWAVGAELNVNNCSFNVTGRSGVTSTNNLNTDFIFIRNNTMTMQNSLIGGLKTGIRVDRNSRSSAGDPNLTSLDISGNTITINGLLTGDPLALQQRGILVNALYPSLDIGLISNNVITATAAIDHRQNGVEVQAGLADRFRVLGNNVTFNDNDANMPLPHNLRWGVSMLYGIGINHRLQNSICLNGGNFIHRGYCGIHLEDMLNVTMCNNTVELYEHGIHLYGLCGGLGFWQNTMDHHLHSVRVQDNAQNMNMGFIGTHTRTANRWNFAAPATNNSSWTGPPLNRLVVPQDVLPFSPTLGNLRSVAFGTETTCMQPPTEGERELTDYDKWVAAGAAGAGAASAWEERRKLMYALLRFPNLVSQDASVSSFYNTEYNTTLGKLAQAEYLFFNSVRQVTEAQNNSIGTLGDQRASLLEQLQDMDEANSTSDPTEVPSPATVAAKQALLNTWKINFSDRSALKQQIAAQRQAPIQQAQQLLATIATTTAQEANWKTMLGIRFNHANGVTPDETALNQLRSIAAQCPDVAGSSAIAAIYLLPEEEAAQLIPHEEIGLSGNCGQPRSAIPDPVSTVLKVSPNPAQDNLLVELPTESSGTWEVFDLAGRAVLTGRFDQTRTFAVETGQFQDGIYLLSVRTSGGNTHFHKFFISK